MTENSKLDNMDSDNLNSIDDSRSQKVSVSNHVNCLHHSPTNSDSFVVVDMERFSHLIEKEINSKSRVTLQRSLSRKGSIRNGERKTTTCNERDTPNSPRASLPETAATVVESVGADHSSNHHHHQITITSGSVSSTTTAAESKLLGKRLSFRRSSSPGFTIDPRRLLFYFATLSCMGTILLIYFTLSIGKLNEDDAAPLD